MRTKTCVHTLVGHTNTVADVKCQGVEPQVINKLKFFVFIYKKIKSIVFFVLFFKILYFLYFYIIYLLLFYKNIKFFQIITGSHDCTIRYWDLASGKSITTLTNHKKSIRSIVLHPTQYVYNLDVLFYFFIIRNT